MANQTHTFNLTPLFIVWTAVFTLLALLTGVGAFWWIAAMPWIGVCLFMVVILGILGIGYIAGMPVTVTRGNSKIVHQRGRKPRALL